MHDRRQSHARPQSAASGSFTHPYMTPQPPPKKKEFGLCDLFLFKVCGCFSHDDMPPPDPSKQVYEHTKSSSSNIALTNTSNVTASSASGLNQHHEQHEQQDQHEQPDHHSSVLSSSNASQARGYSSEPVDPNNFGLVGKTGVEDIPYRRPPPEPTKVASPPVTVGGTRVISRFEPDTERKAVVSAPTSLGGNVTRLSAMFDQN